MIVISRMEGESLVVDDNISVTVVQISGDTIILQIDAPEDADVDLGEDLSRTT